MRDVWGAKAGIIHSKSLKAYEKEIIKGAVRRLLTLLMLVVLTSL